MPVKNKMRNETEGVELTDRKLVRPQRISSSRHGMVATAHWAATEAGLRMLAAGGNAADAAVACGFALGVCEPAASGLGGQSMALIHDASSRRTVALDGSSRAPHRALSDGVDPSRWRRGYRATTVPSTPAFLRYLLERYGTMKLKAVLQPAIELAEEGYRVSELQHALTKREAKYLRAGTAAPFYLKDAKTPLRTGSLFRQPVLAATLKRLADRGVKDFYSGRIARQIVADMKRNGGLIRADDLAQVPRPIERRPLSCRFENLRVLTMPPPAAGRTLVEMLNIISQFPKKDRTPDTPRGAVLLAAVIQHAFRDRRDRPRDPHFYAQVAEKKMLSTDYARRVARRLRKDYSLHGETTHLSVMDGKGNTVALTQSIEHVYGACSVTPELGFLYNDYLSAFELENMAHPHYLRPGGVPWASVAPTIVFRGTHPWLAIGSPGSERITPSIVQVLLRLKNHTPYEAVEAPRLHCTIDGMVSLEAARMSDTIHAALEKSGFTLVPRDPYSFYHGCVQLVVRDRNGLTGVADPRRDGAALGLKA